MNRRDALKLSAAAIGAAAAASAGEKKEAVHMEGGWLYKELEYEKHIPVVEVKREDGLAAISVHVKHPQTAEHHISTFKIYNADRIEITRTDLDPELSLPKTTFYLNIAEGTDLIATTDCNIHGIWMKKFKV